MYIAPYILYSFAIKRYGTRGQKGFELMCIYLVTPLYIEAPLENPLLLLN